MRSSVRSLIITSLTLSSLLCLLTTHAVFATTRHGCAPLTPPAVTGPLSQPPSTAGSIFINEVLLTPHSTWNCSELNTYSATSDTWVELYNPQAQPFDLYAVHASIDSGPNTNPFYLPFGSAIAAHGYLVVFPRTDANFLATESSTWRLLISSIPVDEVKLASLGEDQSYARIPDGGSTWQITTAPTIDASNAISSVIPTPTKTPRGTGTGTGTGGTHGGSATGNGTGTGTGTAMGQGGGETGGESGTGGAGQSPQIDGQQPSWSTMHGPTSVPAKAASPTMPSSPSSPTPPAMDTPRKILLTVLVIALALALVWCWQLFQHPSH